ncbi:MAG: hypothetical protein ACREVA_06920, partial [Burkholderiales bacterium]
MITLYLEDVLAHIHSAKSKIAVFEVDDGFRVLYANTVVTQQLIKYGSILKQTKTQLLPLAELNTDAKQYLLNAHEELLLGVFSAHDSE